MRDDGLGGAFFREDDAAILTDTVGRSCLAGADRTAPAYQAICSVRSSGTANS